MPRPPSNSLSEQKRLLAAEQARIARELAEAEKLARRKPKPVRASLEPSRRLRVSTAPEHILPPRPAGHRFPGGDSPLPSRRKIRRPRAEVRFEQVKFLLLCLLFAALILIVWKNLP